MAGVDQHTAQTHYRDALAHTILTAEDEARLAQRIEAGLLAAHLLDGAAETVNATEDELAWLVEDGRAAREEFITSNLKLALATARPFRDRGMSPDDVIQAAYEGLVKAVDRFDFNLGNKFSTFAVWWIRESLHEAVREAEFVRHPDRLHDNIVKVRGASARITEDLGRRPTEAELVEETNLSAHDVARCLREDRQVLSFESRTGTNTRLSDLIEDPAATEGLEAVEGRIDQRLLAAHVDMLLAALSDDEVRVICALFGLDGAPARSVHAITKEIRSSRRTVNAHRDQALAAMRQASAPLVAFA